MKDLKYIYLILLVVFSSAFASDFAKSKIVLSTLKHNNIDYLSISEFINKHQLKSTYYDSKEKLEIIFEDKRIYFSPFSSYCKVDDQTYHLTYETIIKQSKLYIPILPFYNYYLSYNFESIVYYLPFYKFFYLILLVLYFVLLNLFLWNE